MKAILGQSFLASKCYFNFHPKPEAVSFECCIYLLHMDNLFCTLKYNGSLITVRLESLDSCTWHFRKQQQINACQHY